MQEGPADRSYGVQVAKLAGLPKLAVARAKAVLEELEASKTTAAVTDDMPLFSFNEPDEPTDSDIVSDTSGPLLDLLAQTNPDELSPKQALELIYQLKGLIDQNR